MSKKYFLNIINSILPLVILAIFGVFLGIQLQSSQEYMFFYRESQQLLLLDWNYVTGLFLQFGGVGKFVSQFLVQFFIHPYIGAIVTTLLAIGSAWMFWLTIRKVFNKIFLLPITLLPALVQITYLTASYHHYDGLVALFFMAMTLWSYSLLGNFDYRVRTALGAVMTLMLYLLFGSVGMLFAVCALLFDVALKQDKWYLSALYVAIVGIAGSYMVSRGLIIEPEFAYTPRFYYEFYVELTSFLVLSWGMVVMLIAAALVMRYIPSFNRVVEGILLAVLCLAVVGWYLPQHEKNVNAGVYTYMKLHNNMIHEDWDAILNTPTLNFQSPLNANIVNFALSKKGELLDKLFLYPQVDMSSLLNENFGTFVEEHSVYSEIYYHLGIVSQTLELSLAAMAGTYPGTPLLLQQFIRSRIVMGDYDLAEKFIYRLENTYSYDDWAKQQREFLHDDAAVDADEDYGLKRRTLPEPSSEFASMQGLLYDLMKVLTANQENNVAREYVIACILVHKDFNVIRSFVEEYYGTPILPTLPVRLQEAVVAYAERDIDYCRRYGVSEQTISRFASFRQKILTLRHRQPNANPKSQLSEFRETFWFYVLG